MFYRLLSCVVILNAAALCAAPALPRIDGIKADGDLADWRGQGLRLPFLTPDSPLPPDPARSAVAARFAWDELGLLVAVEVTDTTPSEAPSASAAYLFDSVELFLAPDASRWENFQLVISPGRNPSQASPRHYVFDNRPAALAGLPREVSWAVSTRKDGYVAEARLPWNTLGIRPAPGVAIATRLFVNDENGTGVRTRFAWQPEPKDGRFYTLELGATAASEVLDAPVAWTALDLTAGAGRVNIIGPASLAGSEWTVRQEETELGRVRMEASGALAAGSLVLSAGRQPGVLKLTAPAHQAALSVRDTLATQAASAIVTANRGWRVSQADKVALAFARAEFPEHVFAVGRFPQLNFIDPARVERLLGAAPVITTRWLDAQGRDVTAPGADGLYAARSELMLPERAQPLVLEHIFYKLPDGSSVPPVADETAARLLAFGLQGADATPGHASRVAERWWHGVRRARGWSEALPYKLHVPEGATEGRRPLIVHLHGSGQHTDKATDELLPVLVKRAGTGPIIVYAQSRNSWRGPAVGELIDTLMKTHAIDPDRVYLMGFSMGGIGSWEVALDMPERFAAVVPIGGRMGSPADAARLKNTPLWVFNGGDDPTTTTAEATMMVEAVRRAGGEPRFTVLPGKSHGDSQVAAYEYPGLFEWMLAQRREARK